MQHFGFEILDEVAIVSEGEELCLIVIRRPQGGLGRLCMTSDVDGGPPMAFLDRLPLQLAEVAGALRARALEHRLYVFGANHVAGVFLDLAASMGISLHGVLDDDPEKSGRVMGIARTAVGELDSLDRTVPACVLVAVDQGRSPQLYGRLRAELPESDGHRIESLSAFYRQSWEAAS